MLNVYCHYQKMRSHGGLCLILIQSNVHQLHKELNYWSCYVTGIQAIACFGTSTFTLALSLCVSKSRHHHLFNSSSESLPILNNE